MNFKIICVSVLISIASISLAADYEITDMAVDFGGIDIEHSDNIEIVDSVGQYVSGLNFGTGSFYNVTLSSGYRFPIDIPTFTNIYFDTKNNTVVVQWLNDADYIWMSVTNTFLPNGKNFAEFSVDMSLKPALDTYSDTNHIDWALRFYRIAFEDEFAEEVVGKISIPLMKGWNFLSIPFIPMTNQLAFLFDNQLNPGNIITAPRGDVVYIKSHNSDIILPNFYIASTGSCWNVLETENLDLLKGFYLRIQENSPVNKIVFTGFVPNSPINMGKISKGWNLIAQPYPVAVKLNDTGLAESGLTPGILTKNGHSGDALFTQQKNNKNILLGAFLQKPNSSNEPPYWIGPMRACLEPGKGYWIFIQNNHSEIKNWIYPLPYCITPIEF